MHTHLTILVPREHHTPLPPTVHNTEQLHPLRANNLPLEERTHKTHAPLPTSPPPGHGLPRPQLKQITHRAAVGASEREHPAIRRTPGEFRHKQLRGAGEMHRDATLRSLTDLSEYIEQDPLPDTFTPS